MEVPLMTMSVPAEYRVVAAPHDELRVELQLVAQEGDEFRTARLGAVHDGDSLRAREAEFHRDGARRTARAEKHDGLPFRRDHGLQRFQKTFPVSVLADELFAAPHDAVHRAHHGGGFAQTVEMRNHRDLVRQAAIEAAEAHRLGPAHGRAEVGGRDLHVHVAPVQPVMRESGFDHGDGGIARRALRHRAGEFVKEVA